MVGVPRSKRVVARSPATLIALGWLLAAFLVAPAAALAHGAVPPEPPSLSTLVLGWHLDPLVAAPLFAAAMAWIWLVRRVVRLHPERPVPRRRSAAFFAGLAAIAVALLSGIERYDTTLFSVHMGQHLLLMVVAAPLIALAAPITQLLRAASPAARRRWILPALHSGPVAVLAHPVVAWLAFTLVLWLSHFSPAFDLALENPPIHVAEHACFLVAALLFWWPVVGIDPAPHRMGYAVRGLYLLLQMPMNSFLAMAILFAAAPLYPHYATLGSPYGITALADQQLAGGIMWVVGDLVFIAALLGVVAAWMRHEEREAPAADRRVETQRAALRERADRLAETQARGARAPDG
jgi:cytochrome c oxidase assembly factor CtaG